MARVDAEPGAEDILVAMSSSEPHAVEAEPPLAGSRLARLLAGAPAIIWVLRGPEHVVEFASDLARRSVGDAGSLIGRPIREALPGVEGEEMLALLDTVLLTRRPYTDPGRRVLLLRADDTRSEGFFRFVIDPVIEEDGATWGVMIHAVEVSELVLARRASERANERLLRIERIARALGRALEPAEVGAVAVREGALALGADASVLFRLDHRGWLKMLAASGVDDERRERWDSFSTGLSTPVSDAISGRAVVTVESRAELDGRYPAVAAGGPTSTASVIAAPLVIGDDALGAVAFSFSQDRRFSIEDRLLVSVMATHCSVALQRATLQADRRAIAEREILLGEISHELDSTLDVEGRLRRLVEMVVPRLADLATVRLPGSLDGSRLVAVAHADPALEEVARRVYATTDAAGAPVGPNHVMATGRPELVEHTSDELRVAWASDEGALADLRALDTRSYLSVPLTARGQTLGVLTLQNGSSRRHFDGDDLALCSEIGRRAGLALENAQLFEAEREVAQVLQRRLLPGRLPPTTTAELAVRYLPAEHRAGGDFYGGIERPDGTLSVMVGDVVGHGVEAAATMGQLRSAWRALAIELTDPSLLVERLGRFAAAVPGAAMTTVVCAVIDPDGRMRYACAGHPPPLLIGPDGEALYLPEGRGVPLHCGFDRQAVGEARLAPATTVLFYTDGVIERRVRSIDEGLDALRSVAVASRGLDPEAFLDEIVARVCADAEDDCALLACAYSGARRSVAESTIAST